MYRSHTSSSQTASLCDVVRNIGFARATCTEIVMNWKDDIMVIATHIPITASTIITVRLRIIIIIIITVSISFIFRTITASAGIMSVVRMTRSR